MEEDDMAPNDLDRPPARTADSPYIILEINDQEGETALRVPVVVQNLTAGVVTLEAIYSQTTVGWENYDGHSGNLRLRFRGGEEPIDIRGKLIWTRSAGEGGRHLTLGLELARPTLTARKILGDLIPHGAKDIKGLWDRWDQAYASPKPAFSDQKIYLLGMILLFGGVALQLAGHKSFQLFGWVLWFFGSLAVAGKSLWSIWQKRLPR
jgi:hypothetical protein